MATLIKTNSSGSTTGLFYMTNLNYYYGQSFKSDTNAKLSSALFYIRKDGAPVGNVYAVVYSSTGTIGESTNAYDTLLATSDAINMSTLSSSASWVTFTFSGANRIDFTAGTDYIVAIYRDGTPVAGNYPVVFLTDAQVGVEGSTILKTSTSYVYETYDTAFGVYADTAPLASFTSTTPSGSTLLGVTFTDTSLYLPTAWLWDFGDGSTSTLQNPTHTYVNAGLYDVSLTVINANGSGVVTKSDYVDAYRVIPASTISSTSSVGQPSLTLSDPPPPPDTDWSALGKEDEKVFVYKVQNNGTFIGTWPDVADELAYSQRLNTPGTTTTVRLARSPNTTKETRDPLITQDAIDTLTTEDSSTLIALSQTNNSVGEDTDVDLNYDVDIYVHYGEFANLTTEDGDLLTTEAGDFLQVTIGAPLGTRIFSGFILDYDSSYGTEGGVTVTLASHGMELSNEIIRSGTTTTISYSSTELAAIAKAVLDANPGSISYSTASIATTGVSESLVFRLNTKLEGLESIYDQTPDGWYWYVNVAENLLYLQQKSSGYDHTFYLGQHIKSLRVKRSIEDLKNAVWFVGGETTPGTPSTTVYKYYEDATSQSTWRKGIERITDRRYTVAASMQRRATKLINRYKDPIFTSPLVISSAKYDIESIRLGQTVGFRNFDNFVDELPPLQIVGLSYRPTEVELELGELQERQIDRVAETEEAIQEEQYMAIPNTPS